MLGGLQMLNILVSFVLTCGLIFGTSYADVQIETGSTPVLTERLSENIIQNFLRQLSDLDYERSVELVVPLPGLDRELVYAWNFIGAGDPFLPLQKVVAKERMIKKAVESPSSGLIKDLGTLYFKNKVVQQAKTSDILNQWFGSIELSPSKIFALKMLLLLKSASQLGTEYLKWELFKLLFRLSLSEDITLFDTSKKLSSYFPEVLTELVPEVFDMVDGIWASLFEQAVLPSDGVHSIANIACYVFYDRENAELCFDTIKRFGSADVHESINTFSTVARMQIVSLAQLQEFSAMAAKVSPQLNRISPLTKLIGVQDYGFIDFTKADSNLPAPLKAALLEAKTPDIVMAQADDGYMWLAHKSYVLGYNDTVKYLTSSLVSAFKEYVNTRSSVLTHSFTYRQVLAERENEQRLINSFLQTPEGKKSAQRIAKEIASVASNDIHDLQAQRIQESIAKVQSELDAIEIECKQLQDVLKVQQQSTILRQLVEQKENKKRALLSELEQLEKNFVQSSRQLVETAKQERAEKCVQYAAQIKDLNALMSTLDPASDLYRELSQSVADLNAAINALQQTGALVQLQSQDSVKRSLMIKVYQAEIEELEALRSASTSNDTSTDPIIAKAMQAKNKVFEAGLLAYLNHVKSLVTRLTAAEGVSTVSKMLYENQYLAAMMSDLASDIPEFKKIRDRLFDRLSWIISNSTCVAEHFSIWHYLVQSFLPEFLPTFEQLTASMVRA